MIGDYEDKDTFYFSMEHSQDQKNNSFSATYSYDTPWTILLSDFVRFLEAVGYCGVKEKISVEYSPFREDWDGNVHQKADLIKPGLNED